MHVKSVLCEFSNFVLQNLISLYLISVYLRLSCLCESRAMTESSKDLRGQHLEGKKLFTVVM